MNDNTPGYFDYDDPCDDEEWCGWDDPGYDGMYYDPYRSDITNDATQIGSPESLVKFLVIVSLHSDPGVRNQAPSETPDLASDRPGTLLSESGG